MKWSLRCDKGPARGEPIATHPSEVEITLPGSATNGSTPVILHPLVHVNPESSETPEPLDSRRRIHSRLALALLETLKEQDLPPEILDDENVSVTLPRRLGLSHVVETQIHRYREEARRRRRIPDREVADLFQLVCRRPDAEQVFLRVGERLAGRGTGGGGRGRILPVRLSRYLARRRIQRRLRWLFGRRMVRTTGRPLRVELVDDFLVRADGPGHACNIVLGFAQVELARAGAGGVGLVADDSADETGPTLPVGGEAGRRGPFAGWILKDTKDADVSNPDSDAG